MLDKPAFPYGAGFRSLTAETPAPVALAVTGALPLLAERYPAPHRPIEIRGGSPHL